MAGTTERVRVLIVDDDAGARQAIRDTLAAAPDLEVTGLLLDANELMAAVVTQQPDIVLLDLAMPGRNPLEATVELCRYRQSPTKVVVLSAFMDEPTIRQAIHAGAQGYIVKLDGPKEILRVLREVAGGRVALSQTAAAMAPDLAED